MDYIREAVEQLKEYNALQLAETNLLDQIKALCLELDGIKAQQISFAAGAGPETAEDKTLNNIYSRQVLIKNLEATRYRIRALDRAFAVLDMEEGEVLNRMFVVGGKNAARDLVEKMNYDKSYIYRIKDKALRKFATALLGIGA